MPPNLVGKRYQLLSALGAGGMGAVYLALDRLTVETVALKRVAVRTFDHEVDPVLAARRARPDPVLALAREFQALASLRHPHIIAVRDYGFDPGEGAGPPQPFFTMELLQEPQTILQAGQDQPFSVQVNLLLQLLHALAYLHRRGFLHGDLKPENVLVTRESVVKVLDFGLAYKVEQAPRSPAGTVLYMAPEMLRGEPASPAADLYAVGVIAYELFAGRLPFREHSPSILADIRDKPADVDGLGLALPLTRLLASLLAKTPAERPADAAGVIAALSEATGQPLPLETPATRESFLQAAELVGREAELAQLTGALSQASGGRGSAWLVGGESGVGKSRLLDELRIRALVQGALVLRGQAVSEGGGAYHLWGETMRWLSLIAELDELEAGVLKAVIPQLSWLLGREVPDALESDARAAQTRLLSVVAGLVRRGAAQQPLVLLLEDIHWADANSLALLMWLNRLVADLAVLIVASYRDDERPELPAGLPGITPLPLKRLSRDGTAALSAAMLGPSGGETALVDFLHRETEGNAFFLVEVVRALAEEAGQLDRVARVALPKHVVAGGVQQIVQRRLMRVRPADRPLLELAAVAGRQLDLAILATEPEVDVPAWLTRCADAAVLEPHAEGWRFAHNKFREGLLAELPPDRRRELHRRVALATEAAYPEAAGQARILAYHWGAAGDVAKEAHYSAVAGQQALKASAFRDAVQYFWRALAVFPESPAHAGEDTRTRMALLYRLGEAYGGLGELREARDNLQASLSLARASGDRKGIADTLSLLGGVALRLGETEGAEANLQESLAIALELNDRAGLAASLQRLGNVALSLGQYERARGLYEESLVVAREIGDQVKIARTLNALGIVAYNLKELEEADRRYQESLAIFKAIGYRSGVTMALANLGLVASEQGEYLEARQAYQEALALCTEIGDRTLLAGVLDNLGDVAHLLGDDAEATRYFCESLRVAMETGVIPVALVSLAGIARLWARAGEGERALELLGLALSHPASEAQTRRRAEPLLAQLRPTLPPDALAAALERGKSKGLEAVAAEILGEK